MALKWRPGECANLLSNVRKPLVALQLFQDAVGTVPVTSDGDPVGLALDQHSWGGRSLEEELARQPQLVQNNEFEAADGWTLLPEATISGGELHISAPGPLFVARQFFAVSAGWYEISMDILEHTAGGVIFRIHNSNRPLGSTPWSSSSGLSKSIIYVASAGDNVVVYTGNPGFTGRIGSVSLKKLPLNHAIQSTTTARPVFRDVGGVRYLESDGVDDALNITLPAATYTRAYVNAAGVMTIEEDVAISGTENIMRDLTIAGILYIDRPLTNAEKAKLAAYWGASS